MNRFSSRRQRLERSFLTPRLQGALGYDRIAGYLSSSLLEVAGEALETVVGPIRMVCNSAIEPKDLITARSAQSAMRREWCESRPEALGDGAKGRFQPIAQWEWFRNPVPPASEGIDYRILRQALRVPDSEAVVPGSHFERLRSPDRARLQRIFPDLVTSANPFIRHIVLRTRDYLETTHDPETGEPYLKPVRVNLFGERDEDAIRLPSFLEEAYAHAEEFCRLLARPARQSGILPNLVAAACWQHDGGRASDRRKDPERMDRSRSRGRGRRGSALGVWCAHPVRAWGIGTLPEGAQPTASATRNTRSCVSCC